MGGTQPANPYREAMQEFAASRGYSAEELAERLLEVGPQITLEDLSDWPSYGLGDTLDEVIGMTHEEQTRLVTALRETVLRPDS